jgi:porphobilinogen synthase
LNAPPAPPPFARLRRLRASASLRESLAETRLHPAQLIQPHFVIEPDANRVAIGALPGIDRVGLDGLERDVERDLSLGIASVLLFGVVEEAGRKDEHGASAAAPDGLVPRAIARLRRRFGDALVIYSDVCLCAYTSHGHCGWIADGRVLNDESLAPLSAMALTHARAGADFVAPSDMMDGRVAAIRAALDADGLQATGLLSYAAKFASAYYGPFREAAGSAPRFGDRRTYQMDARNGREAVRECLADEAEGADLLMVKPALAYLDVIARVRAATRLPVVAYNVSGEYAQVKAAAERGWVDEAAVVRENLLAMARAGADLVITYHAREALAKGWLR